MVLNIIGSIRIKIFVSSTCVTVQRFHDVVLSLPIAAALSKNLEIHLFFFQNKKKQISN
jgi:uncharacterized membrane protein YhaH (DUF805 family)